MADRLTKSSKLIPMRRMSSFLRQCCSYNLITAAVNTCKESVYCLSFLLVEAQAEQVVNMREEEKGPLNKSENELKDKFVKDFVNMVRNPFDL